MTVMHVFVFCILHNVIGKAVAVLNIICCPCLQSVTWKRYNDFKKLHKAMFSLHKALHRREEFPPFVKAQLFSE